MSRNNLVAHPPTPDRSAMLAEYQRLQFDSTQWRMSEANAQFGYVSPCSIRVYGMCSLCASYPRHLIVPVALDDVRLSESAKFRLLNRLPVAVWRCASNGAVLLRSAQPGSGLGLFGYRSDADETILQSAIDCVTPNKVRCIMIIQNLTTVHTIASKTSLSSMLRKSSLDGRTATENCKLSNGHAPGQPVNGTTTGAKSPRLLIMDARSWSAAWANRYKGGGYENTGGHAMGHMYCL